MKSIQMANEGKKGKAEKRAVGWILWLDLMQKVAGNDLLFHLFLRIN